MTRSEAATTQGAGKHSEEAEVSAMRVRPSSSRGHPDVEFHTILGFGKC